MAEQTKEKLLRMENTLFSDMETIANQENTSMNQTIETACKFYRDYYHMGKKATFINDELLKVVQANMDYLLQQVNRKSNKILSEVAVQSAMQNQILANELEVNPMMLDEYRKHAVEFLRENNRVLRLDELID